VIVRGDAKHLPLADNSVGLIVTDPPYYKVKKAWWDRQWDTADGFLAWLGDVLAEFHRVLKPNGSLYLFASPKMAARVECKVGERFEVLNTITWAKPGGRSQSACKQALRSFFADSERIIFAEHYNADNIAKGEAGYGAKCDELRGFVFEPLRAYLDGERRRAGITPQQCNEICGNQMAGHYMTRSQWALPTRTNYLKLREGFHRLNHGGDYLRREYEDLRREYEDLRREYEDLRRPFSVTADVPYTDVWTFPTVQAYPGKHPCEKPAAMIEHIITASSREGDVVLDAFGGSGVVAEAAQRLGRRAVCMDIDPHWCEYARDRTAVTQPLLMPA